mmetsp:Transcript_35483/g.63416  ORF Transcript_35483/g.63416 Transcript_35483/m.63416 type:complete len:335 (-) Transcript_35483:114-1118(-)
MVHIEVLDSSSDEEEVPVNVRKSGASTSATVPPVGVASAGLDSPSDEEEEVPVNVKRPASDRAPTAAEKVPPAPSAASLEGIDEDEPECRIEEETGRVYPGGQTYEGEKQATAPLTDEEAQSLLQLADDLYALLGVKLADPPHVVDERYRSLKERFSHDELLKALDPSPPTTANVALLKAVIHAFNVLGDAALRKAYDEGGMEGVEELQERQRILHQMKTMRVSEEDQAKAAEVLKAQEGHRKKFQDSAPTAKPDRETRTVEEKRELRKKLEEAEVDYEWERMQRMQREEEAKRKEKEEKERRYEFEKRRQLRMIEEKEDDLLAFLDGDRFGKK